LAQLRGPRPLRLRNVLAQRGDPLDLRTRIAHECEAVPACIGELWNRSGARFCGERAEARQIAVRLQEQLGVGQCGWQTTPRVLDVAAQRGAGVSQTGDALRSELRPKLRSHAERVGKPLEAPASGNKLLRSIRRIDALPLHLDARQVEPGPASRVRVDA